MIGGQINNIIFQKKIVPFYVRTHEFVHVFVNI
jgi:hypothetical protein